MSEETNAQAEIDKVRLEAEQIAEYKLKHKAEVKIVSEDGEHVLWLRQPSRLAVGYFMAEVTNNVVLACEYVFNDAVIQDITSKDAIAHFQQDANFYGIIRKLQGLISVKKSTYTTL